MDNAPKVKLQTYDEMTVEVIAKTDAPPAALTAVATSITMHSDAEDDIIPLSEGFCDKLIKAEHTSLFEHSHITFLVQGISRSLLAQVTRQRTAHPTSGSQHYQEYSGYPMVVAPIMVDDDENKNAAEEYFGITLGTYQALMENGIPREEARQVLTNACTVNYLMTIDARNLMFFLRQRLCNRNVLEMRIFASKVLSLAKEWFPELFNNVGSVCVMDSKCNQKCLNMQCDQKIYEDPLA